MKKSKYKEKNSNYGAENFGCLQKVNRNNAIFHHHQIATFSSQMRRTKIFIRLATKTRGLQSEVR